MDEKIEEILFHPIKEEDCTDYPPTLIDHVNNPLDIASTANHQDISTDRFCRLCLQEQSGMVPLNSRINSEILALTGYDLVLHDDLPKHVCAKCLTKLDYACNVRKEFIESERKWRDLAECKTASLQALIEDGSICQQEVDLEESIPCNENGKSSTGHVNEQSDDGEFNADNDDSEDDEPLAATKSSVKKKVPKPNPTATEVKPDPNLCYICKERSENVAALNLHLHSHVEMVPYTCERCISEGGTTEQIRTIILVHRHFKMHAGPIPCSKCPHRFWNRDALYNHRQMKHSTEMTCEICGRKLKSKKCYSNHMRGHKAVDEGKFACSFCGKRFATDERKIRHERIHTNERPYQCRYCTDKFATETLLYVHERRHTGERGFRCELCEKAFTTNNLLLNHVANEHESQNRIRSKKQTIPLKFKETKTCPFEGCSFSTDVRSKYYFHKSTHDPRFRCTVCSKQYSNQQLLDYHSYEHTGIKPFCCEICGKGFRKLQILKDHMNGHNNVKPHECEICGQKFSRKTCLAAHRSKHSDERKFPCKDCGKAFKYRVDAWRHEKMHAESGTAESTVKTITEATGQCK